MRNRILMHAIGYTTVALLAVSGTATALPGKNTVDSGDIINRQVKRPDLATGAVNSAKIADGTVGTADLAGAAVRLGKLAANSVDGSKVVDRSLTGADIEVGSITGFEVEAGSITGIDIKDNSISTLDVQFLNRCGELGLMHSYARFKASSSMPSSWTLAGTTDPTYADQVQGCQGATNAWVRRIGVGHYEVEFWYDTSVMFAATPNQAHGDGDNTIAVRALGLGLHGGRIFRIEMHDEDGSPDDGWFNLVTF